jgi:hypothetical protein
MIKIHVENVVLCEDIREEVRGKYTLTGVSAPYLNVPQLPALIKIAVWISGKPTKQGQFKADFQVVDPNGSAVVKGIISGSAGTAAPATIAIGPRPIAIPVIGQYTIQWSFGGKKWDTIEILSIGLEESKTSAKVAA